jgi:hypothetical protein
MRVSARFFNSSLRGVAPRQHWGAMARFGRIAA